MYVLYEKCKKREGKKNDYRIVSESQKQHEMNGEMEALCFNYIK